MPCTWMNGKGNLSSVWCAFNQCTLDFLGEIYLLALLILTLTDANSEFRSAQSNICLIEIIMKGVVFVLKLCQYGETNFILELEQYPSTF